MRIPPAPPAHLEILADFVTMRLKSDPKALDDIFSSMTQTGPTDARGRYLHWDQLRHRQPPFGLDIKTYWAFVRRAREQASCYTPFKDKAGDQFFYVLTDFISKSLHEIDSETHGGIHFSDSTPKKQDAAHFLVRSLIEEPFNSSLLEGAATTRDQAKKLIRAGVKPKTLGEKMVLNNYRAIEFIKSQKGDELTVAVINELHHLLTDGTLDDPSKVGVFRTAQDTINVVDEQSGEVLHSPPAAGLMLQNVQAICDFANKKGEIGFIHPILRAIILHFMLAYEHPYVDGNGRTARALFYWSVVRDGYWLLEYVSISRIINESPVKYGRAFLHTETDSGDLTYFFHHQLEIILKSILDLQFFIKTKQQEVEKISQTLAHEEFRKALNHRQLILLHDAIGTPASIYDIKSHMKNNGVSYLTARSDLEGMVALAFFSKRKRGNKSEYRPRKDLANMIGATAYDG